MSDYDELTKAVNKLSNRKAIRIYESKLQVVWYSFLRGLASGFGTIVGATILITLVIYVLSKFQWVPVIGNFIAQVIVYLETTVQL